MADVSFDAGEIEVIKFLGERFHGGGKHLSKDAIPIPEGKDKEWGDAVLHRLSNYDVIEFDSTCSFEITARIINLYDQVTNPPKRNHWKESLEWWFSSRWRAWITIFTVILPLIVQWVEMIRTVS